MMGFWFAEGMKKLWNFAFTDSESTFVASACECGVAVRNDGSYCGMAVFLLQNAGRLLHGPSTSSGTGRIWDDGGLIC